jgi:hypothetical protein
MVKQPNSAPTSDAGLDHIKALVARIVEFIVSDQARHLRFLRATGFQPEMLQEATQSSLFMLTVLDATAKDRHLLGALGQDEQITLEMIEMCQARLAFQNSAEIAGQAQYEPDTSAVEAKVRDQLHLLLRTLRGRT